MGVVEVFIFIFLFILGEVIDKNFCFFFFMERFRDLIRGDLESILCFFLWKSVVIKYLL